VARNKVVQRQMLYLCEINDAQEATEEAAVRRRKFLTKAVSGWRRFRCFPMTGQFRVLLWELPCPVRHGKRAKPIAHAFRSRLEVTRVANSGEGESHE
jgi:hypothetical protein